MPEEIEDIIDEPVVSAEAKEAIHNIVDLEDIRVRTHMDIDPVCVGNVDKITEDECHTTLITSKMMLADKEGMVHSGFIGSAGEYAAAVAINEPNGMIYSVSSQYFACAKVGDDVTFKAKVRHTEGRKRDVDVIGKIDGIKVYEAHIVIVIPEYHPLKIQLLDVAGAN